MLLCCAGQRVLDSVRSWNGVGQRWKPECARQPPLVGSDRTFFSQFYFRKYGSFWWQYLFSSFFPLNLIFQIHNMFSCDLLVWLIFSISTFCIKPSTIHWQQVFVRTAFQWVCLRFLSLWWFAFTISAEVLCLCGWEKHLLRSLFRCQILQYSLKTVFGLLSQEGLIRFGLLFSCPFSVSSSGLAKNWELCIIGREQSTRKAILYT